HGRRHPRAAHPPGRRRDQRARPGGHDPPGPGRGRGRDARRRAAVPAKNTEEHAYAATGVREALAPLCERLAADPSPFLLRLANVQHLATAVTGTLAAAGRARPGPGGRSRPAPSALAIAAALHPTAAVCGTPADAALELIRELEGMDRGRYAGPVGWVDARGNGEWGIAM